MYRCTHTSIYIYIYVYVYMYVCIYIGIPEFETMWVSATHPPGRHLLRFPWPPSDVRPPLVATISRIDVYTYTCTYRYVYIYIYVYVYVCVY